MARKTTLGNSNSEFVELTVNENLHEESESSLLTLNPQLNKGPLFKALPALKKPVPAEINEGMILPEISSQIGLDKVQKQTKFPTGKGQCVVIIDSGVFNHKDLPNVSARYSTNRNSRDVDDKYGHGTHMAGIIAGRGDTAPGIAPEAEILSIKVTQKDSGDATWSSIYRALVLVNKLASLKPADRKYKGRISVVNLSFNGLDAMKKSDGIGYHDVLEAIETLYLKSIVVVVSAGNFYEHLKGSGLGYPANSPFVLSVGSVDNFPSLTSDEGSLLTSSQRNLSNWSNPGLLATKMQSGFLLAPGANTLSMNNSVKQPYSYTDGTSVSAAVVSGCVLLMQHKARLKGMSTPLNVQQIRQWLSEGSVQFKNAEPRGNRLAALSPEIRGNMRKYFDNKIYARVNIQKTLKLI